MEISVNGERTVFTGTTVRDLLNEQKIDADARGVAVAVNDTVVPRSAWGSTTLAAGDSVEIVKPFRGG